MLPPPVGEGWGGALGENAYEERSDVGNPELANPWKYRRKTITMLRVACSGLRNMKSTAIGGGKDPIERVIATDQHQRVIANDRRECGNPSIEASLRMTEGSVAIPCSNRLLRSFRFTSTPRNDEDM